VSFAGLELVDYGPLNSLHKYAGVLLVSLAIAGMVVLVDRAQPQANGAAATINKNLVVIDPAHGGADAGATLGDKVLEKDVTLALASRLRAALTAAGFTVVATRDADPATPLTSDQRAETADRAHALACLVVHATRTGSGVHIYTSALPAQDDAAPGEDAAAGGDAAAGFAPVPWETAQAGSVAQSLRLAGELGSALSAAGLPAVTGRAHLKPLDNLTCPAVAVEIAPLLATGQPTPVTDADYQRRVSETVAAAAKAWRAHVDAPAAATASGQAQ
jgi:N-acetylmuramoyl-L-alanine amidase